LRGGYLSWKDPKTNHWWQKTWWGRQPQYRDLGAFTDEVAGEGQDKKARVIRERRVLFHVVMLRDFYREQQPLLQSIRAEVEKLIADYST
jgi:hypothetical protein